MGRHNQFTYDGLNALYTYLEEVNDNFELDVIALCCEFTEYQDIEECFKDYDCESLTQLQERTATILFDNHIIIQNF